jgi:hypothetical protein
MVAGFAPSWLYSMSATPLMARILSIRRCATASSLASSLPRMAMKIGRLPTVMLMPAIEARRSRITVSISCCERRWVTCTSVSFRLISEVLRPSQVPTLVCMLAISLEGLQRFLDLVHLASV